MDDVRLPPPTDPQECRRIAEHRDMELNAADRLVYAVLAVAGELYEIRKLLKRR
ncbi:hypothetical protein ACWCXC_17055 [Streptomyces sp. NPDC001515]